MESIKIGLEGGIEVVEGTISGFVYIVRNGVIVASFTPEDVRKLETWIGGYLQEREHNQEGK